jgi:hypothetical protein
VEPADSSVLFEQLHHSSAALAAERYESMALQCQARAFKLSPAKYKPTRNINQAIASLALWEKDACSFVSTGETWACSKSRAASSNNAGVIINRQ